MRTDEIITLIRYDFDNMENRDALCCKTVGVFVADEDKGKTAHGMASIYFENMKPEKLYLGWNGEIYPKYELKRSLILKEDRHEQQTTAAGQKGE